MTLYQNQTKLFLRIITLSNYHIITLVYFASCEYNIVMNLLGNALMAKVASLVPVPGTISNFLFSVF